MSQSRELPAAAADARQAAIQVLLQRQHIEHLRAGAEKSMAGSHDAREAIYFQALLEVGFLVASADGLAEEEREALALLVEQATISAVDKETLRRHFEDLGASSEALGRRERLARAAADLDDEDEQRDAMRFATIVGIADGHLDASEYAMLEELGGHFELASDEVSGWIDEVVTDLERIMAAEASS
jgi:tellurite resistance protein